MFTKTARFYDAIYAFKDYEGAARKLAGLIRAHNPAATTLLDVGCGTGRHLAHLADEFDVAGLDIDANLIAEARKRNPSVDLHVADMTTFDLSKTYDVVTCLFSAIAYVETADRMRIAVERMRAHLRPGGLLVVEPWFGPENYWQGHLTGNFHDEPDLKISWIYLNGREADVSVLNIFYTVGTPQGVEQFEEVHRMGLFTPDQYRAAFVDAGLACSHDVQGLFDRGLYIGEVADAAT